jgi:hypothetical protein
LATEHHWTFGSEDLNSPWLQPGVIGTTTDLGFSPGLKINAWAKARLRGAIPIHALKHVAIHVFRFQKTKMSSSVVRVAFLTTQFNSNVFQK